MEKCVRRKRAPTFLQAGALASASAAILITLCGYLLKEGSHVRLRNIYSDQNTGG
jgi:hypothetical protein